MNKAKENTIVASEGQPNLLEIKSTLSEETWHYQEAVDKVHDLKLRLADMGIKFHRESALGKILRNAETVGRILDCGTREGDLRVYADLFYSYRIADSMLTAIDDPGALECLKRIAAKPLGHLKRFQSMGKNALWELELAIKIKNRGVTVAYAEPDLIIDVGFGKYGIACKKIYSEKGVEARVRSGVQQIAKSGIPGIVALNIDELLPADSFLKGLSHQHVSSYLTSLQQEFVDHHSHKLERFMIDGRCDGILVSSMVISDVVGASTRYNNHHQMNLWEPERDDKGRNERLSLFRRVMHRTDLLMLSSWTHTNAFSG